MNNKKIFLLTCFALVMTQNTNNITAEIPNFEIWNKASHGIQIKLRAYVLTGQNRLINEFVNPQGSLSLPDVDFRKPVFITINNTINYILDPSCRPSGCFYKTAYLSFENGNLRPQKGTWLGLLGTTHRGYDNSSNINQHYIIKSN